MNIAIIPARGGSKRIPKKNIKNFKGKPIIAWSIEAAKQSKLFDYIIVSTDDEEISSVSSKYGALVPFIRPKELTDDYIGTSEVIKHAAQWAINSLGDMEYICVIYATAPFITPKDILFGLDLLKSSTADLAFTVASFPFPIQRALKILSNGVSDGYFYYPFIQPFRQICFFYLKKTLFFLNKA